MYIQVIHGKVKDADAAKAASDRWEEELRAGADGFLGSTSGLASDGTFVVVARFETEAHARRNSERPEQGRWWNEVMSKAFDGEPTFYDCPNVELSGEGGSDRAGFVQIMKYKPSDPEALKIAWKEIDKVMPVRPDIIGGTSAYATDGTVIDTIYFTSEAEAREGEKMDMPSGTEEVMQRFGQLAGDITYFDIKNPILH